MGTKLIKQKIKKKKCRTCKTTFTPRTTTQTACGYKCAIEQGKAAQAKKERKQYREAKKKLKGRNEWKKEAQAAFNAYIRFRDEKDPCISCGKPNHLVEQEQGWKTGGAWDAGHYKTRGGFPELSFVTFNVHKQCKSCNGGSGKYSHKQETVSSAYRERLIEKIGLERVEWLEGKHELKKYSIEDLQRIKRIFTKRLKHLKKLRSNVANIK